MIPVGEKLEQTIPNKNRTIWNIHTFTRAIYKLKTFFKIPRLSRKEKGLMDMDNSVVIAGGREYKGTKW